MDIFIGGVRSRNTALHGDVVAVLLNPQDEWKVFYSQLDAFLEENLDVKKLLYRPLIETSKNDIDNSSTSQRNSNTVKAPKKSNHLTKKETDKNILCRLSETEDATEKRINNKKEFETVKTSTEKKARRRRGKKSKDEKVEHKVVQVELVQEEDQRLETHTSRPTVAHIIQNMPNDWHKFIQKTAVVVHILERKHSRLAAGILKPFADKNPHMALFSPFDCRIPRMKILTQSCPPDFLASPKSYSKIILLAKITEWNDPKFAFGELVRNIGAMGNIEAEIEAMLLENEIDYEEFPDDVVQTLPPDSWTIPAEELRRRTDLRQSTIFTIDPVTARDLDDAVSCLELPNGNLRVGVHIADVTYFLKVNSQLDAVAADRATSVYLPQTVIPMLPRALAENFCSLNPGADRLAFSVIWELTKEGKVEGEWFGRTVIRSCAKLSYDHAQQMIETSDLNSLTADDFPKISDGHTLDEIAAIVQKLHGIAVHLRKKRIQMGALRLDQPRIGFSFDADSNSPNSFYIQEIKDSNRLIEEFMLLANIAVATKIWSTFPKLAVLRRHPRPHAIQLENYIKFFAQNEIYLDASSSRSLNLSLENYRGSDPLSIAKMNFIVNICSKPMKFAKYFCSATATKEEEFHHYALNVSRYTHFTSPIRRYADIMVHRLLAAAINSDLYSLPPWKESTIVKKVDRCNTQRRNAKLVQETSTDLYLALFVRNIGQLIEQGMIIGVLDRAVDVLITRIGITKRCYLEKLPLTSFQYTETDRIGSLVLEWEEDKSTNLPPLTQKLTFFDRVAVALRPFDNEALKINAFIMRPDIPVPL